MPPGLPRRPSPSSPSSSKGLSGYCCNSLLQHLLLALRVDGTIDGGGATPPVRIISAKRAAQFFRRLIRGKFLHELHEHLLVLLAQAAVVALQLPAARARAALGDALGGGLPTPLSWRLFVSRRASSSAARRRWAAGMLMRGEGAGRDVVRAAFCFDDVAGSPVFLTMSS